jgi:hypothetical protein
MDAICTTRAFRRFRESSTAERMWRDSGIGKNS